MARVGLLVQRPFVLGGLFTDVVQALDGPEISETSGWEGCAPDPLSSRPPMPTEAFYVNGYERPVSAV